MKLDYIMGEQKKEEIPEVLDMEDDYSQKSAVSLERMVKDWY
jgi:hypothetical protein